MAEVAVEDVPAPVKRRRASTRKKAEPAADASAVEASASAEEPVAGEAVGEDVPAPVKRRRASTRKKAEPAPVGESAGEPTAEGGAGAESANESAVEAPASTSEEPPPSSIDEPPSPDAAATTE